MAKKIFLLKAVFRELESSDDKFYFNSCNTDFDKVSDDICSENSNVVPVEQRVIE